MEVDDSFGPRGEASQIILEILLLFLKNENFDPIKAREILLRGISEPPPPPFEETKKNF